MNVDVRIKLDIIGALKKLGHEFKLEDIIIEKEDASLGDRVNMLFSGTTVVTGRAKAIVVAVALDTEIGSIADSVYRLP